MTSKSICHTQKTYKANPSKANLDLILRSQEELAAQHEVDNHLQAHLLETLKNEKKWRQREKRLNLFGEEDQSTQLIHASRICAALIYEAEKEAKAMVERNEKIAKKVKAVENKQRNQLEIQERALQYRLDREAKTQVKAEKLAVKKAQKNQFK
jgi:hypothetical protein